MALTEPGARATDNHRRKQVAIATSADSEIRRAWRILDVDDIDGTRRAWERQMSGIIAKYHQVSQVQAAQYLSQYRLAELGTTAGQVNRVSLDLATDMAVLDANGPQAFKKRIGQGQTPFQAQHAAQGLVMAQTRKMILAGGRGLIRESGRADSRAIGWRRKSDGDPCTFCGMLVSRGPAYTSEAKALAKGNEDPYHPNCGCTVEIVYGDWMPTEEEQKYVDSYFDAAEEADKIHGRRTADTVLHRMRDNGSFRDSPARRARGK
jgi:hypothetical protein